MFALLLFVFTNLTLSSDASQTKTSPLSIKVIQMNGVAYSGTKSKESILHAGSFIQQGTLFHVERESFMIVGLGRDVVTKIAGEGSASIHLINSKDWQVDLKEGILAAAVQNPEKRPNHFKVQANQISMGVRGTVFYVENLQEKPLFLCTCTGTVSVTDRAGKKIDLITATHHDRPIIIESDAKNHILKTRTAPMGNGHSDADVTYLSTLLKEL